MSKATNLRVAFAGARMTVRSPGLAPPVNGSTPSDLERQPYLATFKRLIVFELLIHQLDVLRSLLGEFEVKLVELDRVNKDLVGEDEPPVEHDLMANYQACFTNTVGDFANGVRTGELTVAN